MFLLQYFIARAEWAEIRPRLLSPIITVKIDGKPGEGLGPLIDALRTQHALSEQHSSHLEMHHLVLQTRSGILNLDVAQDSVEPREFWVWDTEFQTTVEMGRLLVKGGAPHLD